MNPGAFAQPDFSAEIEAIESRLLDLPEGLQDHVQRSRDVGADLCEVHRVDPERVDLAIAAHDLYRAVDPEELLAEATRRGWEPDVVERADPMLLHGPVAGLWLMQEGGVDDPSIVEAVTWHTTYAPSVGPVATLTFLADKIDPRKVEKRPWLEDVRDLAYRGRAEIAVERYLENLLLHLISDDAIAHPRALDALNYLRLGRRGLL
ncbi:MAG: HD domain-containing protein [Chloroflexi bacterium]|nr:HD domain-containing protein [Chloroflexota bacterium]